MYMYEETIPHLGSTGYIRIYYRINSKWGERHVQSPQQCSQGEAHRVYWEYEFTSKTVNESNVL